jgi:thioesterase domain-containing protein
VAPRDDEERLVADVWGKLLGKGPVGCTDNFFELGGHSMLAVQVIAEIQRRSGRRLPLTALFQRGTVEHLARLLREPETCPPESLLVPLRTNGRDRPFFCIHPMGGTVFCYRRLAELLGRRRPFYAVQAAGLDGLRPPQTTAEAMAADYIESIRTVQRHGPYFLGGWSVGGIIAFEMARQLGEQGEPIGLLALFDAGAMPEDRQADGEEFVRMLMDLFPHEAEISLEEIQAMTPKEQLDCFRERASQAQLLGFDTGGELAENIFEIFKAEMKVLLEYRPRPLPGRITLFRCTGDTAAFDTRSPQLGWSAWSAGVDVHRIPGSHIRMMEEPGVRHLAAALRKCLDRAESKARN